MSIRFAFVGFRHPHILDMYRHCQEHIGIEIVACCEENPATRSALASEATVGISHNDFAQMLDEVPCEVVAVGDCYGLRASRILAALEAGKDVISDKPLCISLAEMDQILMLAEQRGRVIGCMLDMRDHAVFRGMHDVLRGGEIGEVHAVSFEGQHPLLVGRRPKWYFEPGMHGGVLNDIAVHAVDILPWMTGLPVASIVAARTWNATVPQHPHFQQCGQLMLELANGAGVVGDVSYLVPDSFGYTLPTYWRFVVWGSCGLLEGSVNAQSLRIYRDGKTQSIHVDLPDTVSGGYLNSFLDEVGGASPGPRLSSRDVLRSAQLALRLQRAADEREAYVVVS